MLNSSDEIRGKGCTPHGVAESYDSFWFGQVSPRMLTTTIHSQLKWLQSLIHDMIIKNRATSFMTIPYYRKHFLGAMGDTSSDWPSTINCWRGILPQWPASRLTLWPVSLWPILMRRLAMSTRCLYRILLSPYCCSPWQMQFVQVLCLRQSSNPYVSYPDSSCLAPWTGIYVDIRYTCTAHVCTYISLFCINLCLIIILWCKPHCCFHSDVRDIWQHIAVDCWC